MNLENLIRHDDERGTLVEAFKLPHDGQVHYLVMPPHASRGNHYHLRKTEQFLVIYGAAEIQARDRENGNVMKVTTSGERPILATIYPNVTHAINTDGQGCVCLIWCDEQFNKADPDTYPEEI